LMYLAEKDVRGLLRGIADNSAPGSQVVLTDILTDASGRPRLTRLARLSRAAFKAIGEPILWGSEPEALPDFLKACGLQVVEQPTMAEIHTRFTGEAPSRIEDMERFATATVGVARGEKPRTDVD